MTTQRTLASLKEALQQPFAPETIQFLPKEIRQENGRYVCLALPYANKRVYEDRLNEFVFGEWSTPATHPYAQGNKLIIPVTVVILGVAHTDYGEAYLTTTGKNGNTREDDNTATEAYSQAFRRACAKFLLGRYLYDLPKQSFPYDPKAKRIAISKAEQIAWVEKLYLQCGLITSHKSPIPSVAQQSIPVQPAITTEITVSQQQNRPPLRHPNRRQRIPHPTRIPFSIGSVAVSIVTRSASRVSAPSIRFKNWRSFQVGNVRS